MWWDQLLFPVIFFLILLHWSMILFRYLLKFRVILIGFTLLNPNMTAKFLYQSTMLRERRLN